MTEIMHHIKKYANGRLYDVTDKKYINIEDVKDFVRTEVPFNVVVSKTGEDITKNIIEKVKKEMKFTTVRKQTKPKPKPKVKAKIKAKQSTEAKEKAGMEIDEKHSILSQLIQKGGETFNECTRVYADLWHSAMNMAEEQFDKRIKQLVKAKEVSETEAGEMKNEIIGFVQNFKAWVGSNLEERILDIISAMNLASRSQVEKLSKKIDSLNKKLAMLERMEKEREVSPEEMDPENMK